MKAPSPLGARRFQRAVLGKDVLIEIIHPEIASLASSDYRLRSCAPVPERDAGLRLAFHPRLRAGSGAHPGAIFIIAADDIVIDRRRSTTEVDYVSMRRAPQRPARPSNNSKPPRNERPRLKN